MIIFRQAEGKEEEKDCDNQIDQVTPPNTQKNANHPYTYFADFCGVSQSKENTRPASS